jgi:hypothetical protein
VLQDRGSCGGPRERGPEVYASARYYLCTCYLTDGWRNLQVAIGQREKALRRPAGHPAIKLPVLPCQTNCPTSFLAVCADHFDFEALLGFPTGAVALSAALTIW